MKKIIFMGTPEFACAILQTLLDEKYDVIGVVTQPDKKVGREQTIVYSPIKELAMLYNLKIMQPINIKEDYAPIIEMKPDLIVTCAYGQLIPEAVLVAPKYGCVNVHASLLPKLRGGAPIHKAIMYGEENSGVTLMYMVKKMDAGDMLSSRSTPIDDNDTLGSLYQRLMKLGSQIIKEDLPRLLKEELIPIKQDETQVSYAYNVSKEEELVDFTKSYQEIYNHIRSLIPFPVSYAIISGKKMKFWQVSKANIANDDVESGTIVGFAKNGMKIKAGNGYLYIGELQLEGKKKMSALDFENGAGKSFIGSVFNK